MQVANSFWREVLDYLPGLIMLFRIDDQEQAHLMFVNEAIKQNLGFTPEEFILSSESASHIQTQLELLIDSIAEKTHDENSAEKLSCSFYNKQGEEVTFEYKYRLLRLKSSRNPFIAVELYPFGSLPDYKLTDNHFPTDKKVDFVAESEIMSAILGQLETLVDQTNNVVFRGEKSTGKTTLARKFLKMVSLNGVVVYEVDASENSESVEAALRELENVPKSDEKAAVLILHIHELSKNAQQTLHTVLKELKEQAYQLRIVATTNVSLESLMETGDIDASLYYALGFQQILIPPLRKRKEDITHIARNKVPEYAQILGRHDTYVDDNDIENLIKYDWPGNWKEYQEVIRISLGNIQEDGRIKLKLGDKSKSDKQTSLFPESIKRELSEVVTFDEMNKRYLEHVLDLTNDKIYGEDGAASLLGLRPTTLQSKLKKLGIR